jgi:hypothetical protein
VQFSAVREFRLLELDATHCESPIWWPGAIHTQFGGATSSADYKRPEGSTPGDQNARELQELFKVSLHRPATMDVMLSGNRFPP